MSRKRTDCFCAVMLALALSGLSQTNPILNAGFESWSGGVPTNWTFSGKSYIAQETNERYAGNSSARFQIPVTGTVVELTQDITVTGGGNYSFSCRVLDNTAEGSLALLINWRTAGASLTTKTSGHSSDQSSWQQISLANQQAPAEATVARVRLRGYQQAGAGGGFVYADEAVLSGDVSLPVHLSGLEAVPGEEGIKIRWVTESETNTCGFSITRAESADGPFEPVTTVLIPSRGSGSSREEYSFMDRNSHPSTEYWYKLEEQDQNGAITCLGTVHCPVTKETESSEFNPRMGIFPNPFNPSTTLFFSIPPENDRKRIRLDVLDLMGRKILTLADDFRRSGNYSIRWDGRDERGNETPSGVYFCRMAGEDGLMSARRMMKMK